MADGPAGSLAIIAGKAATVTSTSSSVTCANAGRATAASTRAANRMRVCFIFLNSSRDCVRFSATAVIAGIPGLPRHEVGLLLMRVPPKVFWLGSHLHPLTGARSVYYVSARRIPYAVDAIQ